MRKDVHVSLLRGNLRCAYCCLFSSTDNEYRAESSTVNYHCQQQEDNLSVVASLLLMRATGQAMSVECITVRSVVSSFAFMTAMGPKALKSTITVRYTGKIFTFLFFKETSAVSPLVLMEATGPKSLQSTITVNYTGKIFTLLFF